MNWIPAFAGMTDDDFRLIPMKKLVLAFMFLLAVTLQARADISWDFKAGMGGFVKPGRWNFAVLSVTNPDAVQRKASVALFNPVSPEERFSLEINIPPNTIGREYYVYFFLSVDSVLKSIAMKLTLPGQAARMKKRPVLALSRYAGVTCIVDERPGKGGSNGLVDYIDSFDATAEDATCDKAIKLSPAALPDRALGLDAVDTLVVGRAGVRGMSRARREAIANFVSAGGRLVVLAAVNADSMRTTFIEELAGVKIGAGTSPLDAVKVIPSTWSIRYGRSSAPKKKLAFTTCKPEAGTVWLRGVGDEPLVFRNRWGVGEVFLVAFDPVPLTGWKGLYGFWSVLLARVDGGGGMAPSSSAEDIISGFVTKGEKTAKTALLMVVIFFLTILYALIIGPLDFVLLKGFKRFHWAYRTFLGIVLGSALVAYLVSTLFIQEKMDVKYLSCLNVSASAPASGSTLFSVFAPKRGYIPVSAKGGKVPEGALGGTLPIWAFEQDSGSSGRYPSVLIGSDGEFEMRRIFRNQQTLGFRSKFYGIEAHDFNKVPESPLGGCDFKMTESMYRDRAGKRKRYFFLDGGFKSGLPFELEDAYLAVGGSTLKFARLGRIVPGKEVTLKGVEMLEGIDLLKKRLLTGGRDPLLVKWKLEDWRLLSLVNISFNRRKPQPSEEGSYIGGGTGEHFHPNFCVTDMLRDATEGVIVGFAKDYSPLEIGVPGRHRIKGITIVRIPVAIGGKRK